mmetsp:Transcript_28460/g.43667  ORF Transcript_28460/g.43667 Transcript_28460/m.43667 type:complete len:157 (-) Transcript_28460:1285-1755(-)
MSIVPLATGLFRIGFGIETIRHGIGKIQSWPEFETILRSDGPWGKSVFGSLLNHPISENQSLVLATVGTAAQTLGGACLVAGVAVRPVCIMLEVMMGVVVHWQCVTRNKSWDQMFDTNCDSKGLGPAYFVLGYGGLLILGPGNLRLLSSATKKCTS